jgi:hypothetical protein
LPTTFSASARSLGTGAATNIAHRHAAVRVMGHTEDEESDDPAMIPDRGAKRKPRGDSPRLTDSSKAACLSSSP